MADEKPDEAQRYMDELRSTVERETLRHRALESAMGWCDAAREDAIRALTAFELEKLSCGDTPVLLVAMLRADIAGAIRQTRRAGILLKHLGLPTEKVRGALVNLRAAADGLPPDFPKPPPQPAIAKGAGRVERPAQKRRP